MTLISADKDIQPDALAGLAASAALAVSDIPLRRPHLRSARRAPQRKYAINPNFSEMPECGLDIMVGGTIDNILMVEGEMKEVSEDVMLGAIKFAHEEIKKHCAVQIELSERSSARMSSAPTATRSMTRSCARRSSASSTTRPTPSPRAAR